MRKKDLTTYGARLITSLNENRLISEQKRQCSNVQKTDAENLVLVKIVITEENDEELELERKNNSPSPFD